MKRPLAAIAAGAIITLTAGCATTDTTAPTGTTSPAETTSTAFNFDQPIPANGLTEWETYIGDAHVTFDKPGNLTTSLAKRVDAQLDKTGQGDLTVWVAHIDNRGGTTPVDLGTLELFDENGDPFKALTDVDVDITSDLAYDSTDNAKIADHNKGIDLSNELGENGVVANPRTKTSPVLFLGKVFDGSIGGGTINDRTPIFPKSWGVTKSQAEAIQETEN